MALALGRAGIDLRRARQRHHRRGGGADKLWGGRDNDVFVFCGWQRPCVSNVHPWRGVRVDFSRVITVDVFRRMRNA